MIHLVDEEFDDLHIADGFLVERWFSVQVFDKDSLFCHEKKMSVHGSRSLRAMSHTLSSPSRSVITTLMVRDSDELVDMVRNWTRRSGSLSGHTLQVVSRMYFKLAVTEPKSD
jgi:hypothetical protein